MRDIREAIKSLNEARRALEELIVRTTVLDFDVYDAAGLQEITGSEATLNLDTEAINADASVFDLTDDVITITDDSGRNYWFNAHVSVSNTGENVLVFWLEQDSGDGYEEVRGTRCRIAYP